MIENSKNYKYVDLGLPSGTLWCDRNLGANSPEDFGLYYQWGNTEGKNTNINLSKWKNNYDSTPGSRLIRDIIPGSIYDAATQNLDSPWEMPTEEQFKELFDDNYVNIEWVEKNGKNGILIKGKNNNNSIFLPAAGYIQDREENNTTFFKYVEENTCGSYWNTCIDLSNTIRVDDGNPISQVRKYEYASNLAFSHTNNEIDFTVDSDGISDHRYCGFSIRPVYNIKKVNNDTFFTNEEISETLYDNFIKNKIFNISKINTIYDEKTPEKSSNINGEILNRLMTKTDNGYKSNISKCSNSLIVYKYKYDITPEETTQENKIYYTGINIYYCDNNGLCFPIIQNTYNKNTNEIDDIDNYLDYTGSESGD